jgi:hypothetical protein
VDAEWSAYSEDVRRRRPRCEAGPRWTSAVALLPIEVITERYVARILRARDECAGGVSSVHHKSPRGRGPIVPSQGLLETDVVSICTFCHDAAENNLRAAAEILDLIR